MSQEPPPPARKGSLTWLWILLGVGGVGILVCCGGCLGLGGWGYFMGQQAKTDADKLWTEGKKDEAIEKYKSGGLQATTSDSEKADILKKIFEYEVQKGTPEKATEVLKTAFVIGKVPDVKFDDKKTQDLFDKAKKEAEDKFK